MEKAVHFSLTTRLIHLVIGIELCIVLVSGVQEKGLPVSFAIIVGVGILAALFGVYIAGYSLSVDGVEYTSLIGRKTKLLWSEISEVTTRSTPAGRLRKSYEMRLWSNTPSKRTIRINVRQFRKVDMTEFASTFFHNAPHAVLDEATGAMAQGVMPWDFTPSQQES